MNIAELLASVTLPPEKDTPANPGPIPLRWADCCYCGRSLGNLAVLTQTIGQVGDAIDYCRRCAPRAALDRITAANTAGGE